MEIATTEPLNEEEAAKQQQKARGAQKVQPRLRPRSQTKASECEHCKKTFSSVSASRDIK